MYHLVVLHRKIVPSALEVSDLRQHGTISRRSYLRPQTYSKRFESMTHLHEVASCDGSPDVGVVVMGLEVCADQLYAHPCAHTHLPAAQHNQAHRE